MGCDYLHKKVDGFLGKVFGAYGAFVARHPWWFIVGSSVISIALGFGITQIKEESHVEVAYTPSNGRAKTDRQYMYDWYPDVTRSNFQVRTLAGYGLWMDLLFGPKDGSNVLSDTNMNEIKKLYNDVLQHPVGSKNSSTYNDLCALVGGECGVQGRGIFTNDFNTDLKQGKVTFPMYNDPKYGLTALSGYLLDPTVVNGTLSAAKYLRIRLYLGESSDVYDDAYAWMESARIFLDDYTSDVIDIRYTHVESLNMELDRSTKGDILFIGLTFAIMITYASLAITGTNCLSNRGFLAIAGVIATGISIFGGMGFVALCGVKYVNIVGLMPFLVLGVGVDDMFILLSSLADVQKISSTEEKIRAVMKSAGVAVTITSITDFLGFCVGSISIFIAVESFCLYTGISILFCYFNQMTFFTACMALNENRVGSERHSATCRIMATRETMEANGDSKIAIACCGARIPQSRQDVEGFLERYPRILVSKLLQSPIVRGVILVVFAVYLAVAIYGASSLKEGLELKDTTPDDSYYNQYQQWFSKLPFVHPVGFVFDKEMNYWDANVRDEIEALLTEAEKNALVQPGLSTSWVRDFASQPTFNYTTKSEFVTALKLFVQARTTYKDDVIIDKDGNIPTSRIYVTSESLDSTDKQGNIMIQMRELADGSTMPVFSYCFPYIFYEQYTSILSSTLQTVGVTVAAVVVATLIFMPHPVLILYTLIALIMILVGIFGFMTFWGLSLSAITMVLLIMSVGFAVDYSVHVSHAYLQAEQSTRLGKMNVAIEMAASPILNAALSSFFGVFMLLFSSTYIFRTFFKMMFLVIVFGFCHSSLFLPSLLSFTGPKGSHEDRKYSGENNEGYANDMTMESGKNKHLSERM